MLSQNAENFGRNQRLPVQRHGLMRQGQKTWSILIKDASSGGVGVQFLDDVPEIEHDSNWQGEIEVRRAGKQVTFPVIIRSGSIVDGENHYGFAYTVRTPEVFMAIAEVMYSDQENPSGTYQSSPSSPKYFDWFMGICASQCH